MAAWAKLALAAGLAAQLVPARAYPAEVRPAEVRLYQSRHPPGHRSEAWAREHFTNAERMREALNGRPPADRSRHDYQRVVNAYREVYLGAPASAKAEPSVVAVAETLVEMGRRFDDDQILNKAIEQYRFLRREYPGSKYRFDGLFTIGEIYKDDLNNSPAARVAFEEFLRRYPRNRLADDAREAISEIDQGAQAAKEEKTPGAEKASADKESVVPESRVEDIASQKNEPSLGLPAARPGKLPRVTGIRHWSTPDYTRVAIDVEGEVKFSSQRIGTPSRIYFDLKDTRLASTLVGKSFDVDDGFLKKVRVAQFAPGRTRVVLEVDNLSDYDAFLLPNPYRLIVDIHGKGTGGKEARDGDNGSHTRGQNSRELSVKDADGMVPQDEPGSLTVDSAAAPPMEVRPGVSGTNANGASQAGSAPPTGASDGAQKAPARVVKKVVVEADDDDDDVSTSRAARANKSKRSSAASADHQITDGRTRTAEIAAAPEGLPAPNQKSAGNSSSALLRPSHGGRKLQGNSDSAPEVVIREARPTASGDRSLIRALGLKIGRIVIDPGHGGHDAGTVGSNGLEEKDLVLEVGRRLGKLLESRLGAEVIYTRKDDTFIPLETRTAIANQARADLFVSIHANSSDDPDARGVETYYLNFTSSPEALEVAARENAVSEKSVFELQDLVKKIALKEKIDESREFAGDVQQSLYSGLAGRSPAIRDRGVKKAPFIVLIGANMPSILAEISFVSNPADERALASSEYRERIAESLYRGIAKYANGLSGVKVASKMEKEAGQ